MPKATLGHYTLVWIALKKHFPGFVDDTLSRIALKIVKPRSRLKCHSFNLKNKSYEGLSLYVSVNEKEGYMIIAFDFVVSVLPNPTFRYQLGLEWFRDVGSLARNIDGIDFTYANRFKLKDLKRLPLELDRLFSVLSPFVFRKMEEAWDQLLRENPNSRKCIHALDDLRAKYPQMIKNPEVVKIEEIESSFRDKGLPLVKITNEMEEIFQKRMEKISSTVHHSDLLKYTFEELNNCGLLQYGFNRFRNAVLKSFGKSDSSISATRVYDDILTNLSKSGNFAGYEEELDELSEKLNEEEVERLYILLRDNSERMESEWKEEFFQHFPRFKKSFSRLKS